MSDGAVPDPTPDTHDVLVEIRDELRALRRDLNPPPDEGDTTVPVDGR